MKSLIEFSFIVLSLHFLQVYSSIQPAPAKIDEFPGSKCNSDEDCVVEGMCVAVNNSSNKYCRCFRSCPAITPTRCRRDADCYPGNFNRNVCNVYKRRCMCPSSLHKKEMCTKNDVDITSVSVTNDSPYAGERLIKLKCCINMDSRSVFLRFFHNSSHELYPTKSPVIALNRDNPVDPAFFDNCWYFDVHPVRFRDSGIYSCNVSVGEHHEHVVKNIAVLVREWTTEDPPLIRQLVARLTPEEEGSITIEPLSYATTPPSFIITQPREPIRINLTANSMNSTATKIEWQTSPMNFSVSLKLIETMENTRVIKEWRHSKAGMVIADNLRPATFYLVTAETEETHNKLSDSAKVRFQTPEDIPDSPTFAELVADNKQFTKCEMSWRAPADPRGTILRYEVHLEGVLRKVPPDGALSTPDIPASQNCPHLNNVSPDAFKACEFVNLQPNRNYTGYVVAVNSAGKSKRAYIKDTCMSNYGPPDKVPVPHVTKNKHANKTHNLLTVQLTQPDQTNGPIVCYYVAVVPLAWDSPLDDLPPPSTLVFSSDSRESFAAVSKRHKRRETQNTMAFDRNEKDVVAYIAESYASLPELTVLGDQNQTLPVCSVWYDGRYGSDDVPLRPGYRYTGFLIVRVEADRSLNFASDRFRVRRDAWQLQPAYGYSNYFPPVVLGEVPALFLEEANSSGTLLVILLCIFVLLLVLIAVTLILYFRKRHWWKKCFSRTNIVPDRDSFVELTKRQRDFQPIPVDDLPSEYLVRHRDSDFLFAMEFEALPHYSNFDTMASDLPLNSKKNRYNDIKAYDVSRVKLNIVDANPNSQYINANFVQGYKGRKNFIAAQGPLADTVADFWRMVWEQNSSIVIMVANLYEKYRPQCTKYWPEEEATKYGSLTVKPLDAQYFSDFAIRKFEIRKTNNGEKNGHIYDTVHCETNGETVSLNGTPSMEKRCSRIVYQYHYTGWHDYRAPECTTGLLRFLMRLRKIALFNEQTVIVHCSAGVGRTGTFIAIDGILDQCIEENTADVYGFVSNLRRQRNFMVQSLEQYVFVYKALAEWHSFGDTDIEVDRIREHVRLLRHTPSPANQSPRRQLIQHHSDVPPMRLEYQKLSRSLETGQSCEFARKDLNECKNRIQDVVPYDRNRVILPPLLGTVDASYINASVVRGYSHAYILAQDPLESTKWDMWRMICENNVSCVVSLTKEDSIPNEEKYWPGEGGVSLGDKPNITVRLICEESTTNFVMRRLSFSHPKEKELRELTHFSYLDWPNSIQGQTCEVPRSTGSLLQLIGKVMQRQNSIASGSVLVHCGDGSSRSGLYTAVSMLLQRLKSEGRIDVLQTVKSLQAQRQRVIPSLAQYEFCYQAVLDYLESFC